MHRIASLAAALVIAFPAVAAAQTAPPQLPAPKALAVSAFSVEHSITVPGAPADVFGAITGDLLPWWDHFFTPGGPAKLYLEPKVGGCFCEEFDADGHGARHAVVTFVDPGKRLIFEGPLGFAGTAVQMVTTYEFAARGDSTVVTVKAQASGAMEPGSENAVNGVWHHFLVERFKPYWERTRGRRG